MRKYLFLTGMIALSAMTMNAQDSDKAEQGAWILEAGFTPFAAQSIRLQEGQVKAVYMYSDEIGFRLGLGFQTNSKSNDNGLTGDRWAKKSEMDTELTFTPGVVRFLPGTETISTYVGAELIFATNSNKETSEEENYKKEVKNSGDLMNTYGLGVFSGFNYYFSTNLYIGAEINLAFKSQSFKNTITTVIAHGSTETSEPENKVRSSS
ncbi:MAG: hypothetical protein LBQ73_10715, partial [Tannerellaceae bacterium]|nr:hypothetical protein [Tannerellaceae bacterium]